MKSADFYGAARARRSLFHWLGGKALSAVTGVVFLVCVVRATPAAQYGVFVVLLALLEVFYLASGFGLSTMAQRYVAEFRLRAPRAQFQGFVWMLMRRRLGLAVLGAALVGFLWPTLMGLLRLDLPTNTRGWVLLWLIVGCGTRYLDEVLPALLLQAASQLLSILTNLLRLGCLLAVTVLSMALDHQSLVIIELGVASVTGLCGLIWLRLYLLASAASAANTAAHHNPVMWAVSMRFFVVQLLGQGWSPNMARMLVSRIAGGAHTASFGFSLALVDMLRNYLPTYLLASWVRPLMVARYVATGRVEPVLEMAGAIFKLSLITLVPFVGLLAVHGDSVARWVSGGRYGEGAGHLMAALVVLLALQSLHLCLGLVCATLERAAANIWATAACLAALPLAWLLWPALGLLAVPLALGLAETCWVAWVAMSLRRAGFAVTLHWQGLLKVVAAGGIAAGLMLVWAPGAGLGLVIAGVASGLVVLAVCMVLRPLTEGERGLFAQVVPRRWLLL